MYQREYNSQRKINMAKDGISSPPAPAPVSGSGPLLPPQDRGVRPLRQQVLEQIRACGQISRSEVAKELGISPASVSAIVSGLVAEGLVTEIEGAPRESGRGRPPVALKIVPEAGFVVGINLRSGLMTAVVLDFAGNEVANVTVGSDHSRLDLDAITERIDAGFAGVLAKAGLAPADIAATGIGIPGYVQEVTGLVYWSPILKLRNVNLGDLLSNRLNCPVFLDNDVNLLALAELWFGVGRGLSDFAVVTIEQGVGMGSVQGGRIFRGARGLGLELGHTTMQIDGALCRCGQRGCLEAYVADYALVREASTALDWENNPVPSPAQMIEILFDQAKAGNQEAQLIFRRAGRYLSAGMANMIRLFDPELVILSGARLRYDFLYAEEVLSEVHHFSDRLGRPRTPIEVHTWGDLVWARGAAALALSEITAQAGQAAEAASP